MTPEQWGKIRHFKPTENWGDVRKICFELVFKLDQFRGYIKKPVYVLGGYKSTGTVHVKNSQHYDGRAVDCFIEVGPRESRLNLLIAVYRFGFTGLGVYPDWQMGGKRGLGLHLDVRPVEELLRGQSQAQWMGVEVNNKNEYFPLDELHLRRFNII